jgi:peptide/nickel transport system substrate-binding protein
MSMAIDRRFWWRSAMARPARSTCNWVPAPEASQLRHLRLLRPRTSKAPTRCSTKQAIVDSDGDGVRETPDGVPMSILYQTSTNAVRQDFQALIKQWWEQIGIETELRNIDASVFFGGDPGSPDTFQKFYADVEMYANTFNGTDPQAYLGNGLCDKARVRTRSGRAKTSARFCMEEYDALHAELTGTADIQGTCRASPRAQRHDGRRNGGR